MSCREDWPLVDREDELATLRQAVDAARVGWGGVVVVEGDPGSGRTRLVREAVAEARQMDFRVVWLPDRPDVAASIVAAAVADAARGRPLVIVNDHGPPVSFMALGVDVSRLPVLAIVTETVPVLLDEHPNEVESERHVTRVRIRALRPGAVMALAARMGTLASIPALERLHAVTAGNALLVIETLAALRGTDGLVDSEPWPLSERAMRWMRARLDAMTPVARDALEAASVLGDECDVVLVRRVVGSSADRSHVCATLVTTALTAVRKGGERCRFVAPLARDLVYASLSAERRAMLHARAAAELTASGTTSPVVLAHHILAASATGDARRCEHFVGRLVRARMATDAPLNPSKWPYFVREGEHWAIGFGDQAIRLGDRTGLLYLARLLSRPGVEFAALALGERHRARNGSEGANREPTLAAERARVRVTRRIRDGIERIARVHPELGAHLEQTIRTGAHCAYVVDPINGPRWEVRWAR